jgi:hypothetical protein
VDTSAVGSAIFSGAAVAEGTLFLFVRDRRPTAAAREQGGGPSVWRSCWGRAGAGGRQNWSEIFVMRFVFKKGYFS